MTLTQERNSWEPVLVFYLIADLITYIVFAYGTETEGEIFPLRQANRAEEDLPFPPFHISSSFNRFMSISW